MNPANQAPLANAPQVLGVPAVAQAPVQPPKPVEAGTLVVTTTDLRATMETYARFEHAGATFRTANDFDQFASLLGSYSQIGELVILVHGSDGALEFRDANTVSIKALTIVLEEIVKRGGVPQVTRRLAMPNCIVASHPHQMMLFGQAFGAPVISGFTYYHVLQPLPLAPGVTLADLEALEREYEGYLLPSTPPAQAILANLPAFPRLLAHWFRGGIDDPPKALPKRPDGLDDRERNGEFYKLASLRQLRFTAAELAPQRDLRIVDHAEVTIDL